MLKRRTNFLVGLFVATGVVVTFSVIIWLGMSNFFAKGTRYAVYFDESVQGLSVDAPVKYRGVSSGRVIQIGVAPDMRHVEVVLEINSSIKPSADMIAELKVVGITGSMYIELDNLSPGTGIEAPAYNFPTRYPVIRSRPSDIKKLFSGIDQIVEKLNTIDIAGLFTKVETTIDHLDTTIQGANTADISNEVIAVLQDFKTAINESEFPKLAGQLQVTLANLDRNVDQADLGGISSKMKRSLDSVNQNLDPERWANILNGLEDDIHLLQRILSDAQPLLSKATGVVGHTETGLANLNSQLSVIGQNLEKSTEKIDRILDTLDTQPSQLLFGQPPPPRSFDGKPLGE